MDKEGDFKYQSEPFPRLSEAPIKEGIFTGPGISKVIREPAFGKRLNKKVRAAQKESICESM